MSNVYDLIRNVCPDCAVEAETSAYFQLIIEERTNLLRRVLNRGRVLNRAPDMCVCCYREFVPTARLRK